MILPVFAPTADPKISMSMCQIRKEVQMKAAFRT